MRRLTHEGFLEKYICELSGLNTSSVSKTLKVLPDNPRILEPLALYAVMTNVSYNIISKNKDFMSECSMLIFIFFIIVIKVIYSRYFIISK